MPDATFDRFYNELLSWISSERAVLTFNRDVDSLDSTEAKRLVAEEFPDVLKRAQALSQEARAVIAEVQAMNQKVDAASVAAAERMGRAKFMAEVTAKMEALRKELGLGGPGDVDE